VEKKAYSSEALELVGRESLDAAFFMQHQPHVCWKSMFLCGQSDDRRMAIDMVEFAGH